MKKPLIITALYDIGRSKWKTYHMANDTYLAWMQNTLDINCEMVVFTEPKLEGRIREMRSSIDPNNEFTTWVINNVEDLEMYKAWNYQLSLLMSSNEFKSKVDHPHVPEMSQPLYNIIMFNKVSFLKSALDLKPDSTHLIWLDAGGIRENIDSSVGWPNLDKLADDTVTHFSHNVPFTISDSEWHALSQVRNIQGTAFICPSFLIDWFKNEIHKTIDQCLNDGFIGSDEKIFDITYLKDPKRFTLIQQNWREYYDWLKI